MAKTFLMLGRIYGAKFFRITSGQPKVLSNIKLIFNKIYGMPVTKDKQIGGLMSTAGAGLSPIDISGSFPGTNNVHSFKICRSAITRESVSLTKTSLSKPYQFSLIFRSPNSIAPSAQAYAFKYFSHHLFAHISHNTRLNTHVVNTSKNHTIKIAIKIEQPSLFELCILCMFIGIWRKNYFTCR